MWDDPTTEADSMIYIGGCADRVTEWGGSKNGRKWGPSLFRFKRDMGDSASTELYFMKIDDGYLKDNWQVIKHLKLADFGSSGSDYRLFGVTYNTKNNKPSEKVSIFHIKLKSDKTIDSSTLKREEYKFEDGKYDVLGLDDSVTDNYFHMILVKTDGKKLTYFKIDHTTTG